MRIAMELRLNRKDILPMSRDARSDFGETLHPEAFYPGARAIFECVRLSEKVKPQVEAQSNSKKLPTDWISHHDDVAGKGTGQKELKDASTEARL